MSDSNSTPENGDQNERGPVVIHTVADLPEEIRPYIETSDPGVLAHAREVLGYPHDSSEYGGPVHPHFPHPHPADPSPHYRQRYVTIAEDGTTQVSNPFDMFRQVFESQAYFQRLLGHDASTMSTEEKVQYIKDQVLALLDEGHEALNEVGWKPWASSRHINQSELAGELADILCFLVNLALAAGLSAEDFYALHQEKALRNIKRQEEKYDGVSGKCPGCGRAIDDLKAKNLPVGQLGGVDYCSPQCINKVNPHLPDPTPRWANGSIFDPYRRPKPTIQTHATRTYPDPANDQES